MTRVEYSAVQAENDVLRAQNRRLRDEKRELVKKAGKAFCDTCMGQCKDRSHCDTLQRFMNAMEE